MKTLQSSCLAVSVFRLVNLYGSAVRLFVVVEKQTLQEPLDYNDCEGRQFEINALDGGEQLANIEHATERETGTTSESHETHNSTVCL